jgi:hypothetical protein
VPQQNKRGNLSTLIVTHKRWLSVAGLLIVLATYVAKETLLEEIKASADSIEAAQQQFAVRQECLSTKNELAVLERNLPTKDNPAAYSSIAKQPPNGKTVADQLYLVDHYNEGIDELLQPLDLVRDQYQASADVASRLPRENSADGSAKKAADAIAVSQTAIDNERAQIEKFDKQQVTSPTYNSMRRETIEAYLELGIPYDKAREATNAMSRDVSTAAGRIVDEQTARSRKIKLACQLLFAFGWGLSLIDKIFLDTDDSVSQ